MYIVSANSWAHDIWRCLHSCICIMHISWPVQTIWTGNCVHVKVQSTLEYKCEGKPANLFRIWHRQWQKIEICHIHSLASEPVFIWGKENSCDRYGSSAVPFTKCGKISDLHLTSQQAEGTWIFCYIQGIELPQDQVARSLWGFCLVFC